MTIADRTLIILAHPHLSRSRVNAYVSRFLSEQGLSVHDLYQLYPNFEIDVAAEQELLVRYDRVVLLFPLQWYSVPGLLKQWFDEVLTLGWGYRRGGPGVLEGKTLQVAVSTAGTAEGYRPEGFHHYTMEAVLVPLAATARRLGMHFDPPTILNGVRDVDDTGLDRYAHSVLNGTRGPEDAFAPRGDRTPATSQAPSERARETAVSRRPRSRFARTPVNVL